MDNNNKPIIKPTVAQVPMQPQEPQQVIVEREITLGLLNEKLNVILNILTQPMPEPKK